MASDGTVDLLCASGHYRNECELPFHALWHRLAGVRPYHHCHMLHWPAAGSYPKYLGGSVRHDCVLAAHSVGADLWTSSRDTLLLDYYRLFFRNSGYHTFAHRLSVYQTNH